MKRNYVYALVMIAITVFASFYFVGQNGDRFEQQLQLVIEYEDGSTRTFSPEKVPLLSDSIIDSTNKAVRNLRAELYVKVDYSGSVAGWDASGTLQWIILDSSKAAVKTISRSLEPMLTSGAPPKNTPFVISSATVSASDIEALWSGWENGKTYYLKFYANPLFFTLKFGDGTTQRKVSSASFDWQFRYEGGNQFTSLQVTWQPVAYY